jgi:hypothetical protein
MRLFLDLDTRSFIESAQFQRAVSALVLKRRDRLPVDVQFLRSGVVVGLADGATGKLGLKADKDFNGSFAASDLEWTKSGTGDTTAYRFDLNLNTVQINALFAGVPTPATVTLMLEIEWAEGDLRTSSNTLAVALENDIVRGDEGVAEEGGPVYPLPSDLMTKSENADLLAHPSDTDNPHAVTAAQVGLENVENTSDADKPVSTAMQAALNAKANAASLASYVQRTPPAANFRFKDGTSLQLFNPDTNTWHSLAVRGASGQETLEISAAIP